MATRPVFYVGKNDELKTMDFDFDWNPGFALSQKRRNIENLHSSIVDYFNCNNNEVLEISSKSENALGVGLSAFNLEVNIKNKKATIETIFQSSKVFEYGGPFQDLLFRSSIEAKKDSRLKESGKLIHFDYFGEKWSKEPKTLFYDWIYINAVYLDKEKHNNIIKYTYFTDIEFNPKKSLNCQAKSAALYVSLYRKGLLEKMIQNKDFYIEYFKVEDYSQISLL